MNPGPETRKLAAIMFTDMVGYSALSQHNDKLAQELLEEHRALLRPLFPRYNGTEIKTIGDAFLVEFHSALEAAQCAIEIQRALAKRNHDVPNDRRVEIKIGIHIGDVVHRGGDVYGDGVNIASRIEPLAGAGGICISMDVERQIRNALEARFEKLAPTELKNISVAMDLFRIVLPWQQAASHQVKFATTHDSKSNARAWALGLCGLIVIAAVVWFFIQRTSHGTKQTAAAKPPLAPSTPPAAGGVLNEKSIAVLPFANMSDDKGNVFFADGIHEDLLTKLALVHDLHVVSRTSVAQYRDTTKSMRQIAQELGVAYVLEGSVRREGNKVRVTGQLIRAASDEHVWAKSYDRDLTDIFAIQSQLATEIADSLQAAISPKEKSLIENRPTDNLAAYDLYLKGRAVLKGMRTDLNREQAEQALSEAVKLDPNFAAAWGTLALAHASAVFGDEDRSPERLAKAKAAIDTAVRLAPDDPEVIEMLGNYYYYGYRDYTRAAEQYQRLLVVRPNSAEAYAQLGYLLRRQAHWAEALANLRHAVELDPRNIHFLSGLTEILSGLRCYDEALVQARRMAELAHGDLLLQAMQFQILFLAHGKVSGMAEALANLKSARPDDPRILYLQAAMARGQGDWAQVVKLDEKYPYLDPFTPHLVQDAQKAFDLVAANDLPAARSRAEKLIPEFKTSLDKQPDNSSMWGNLALLHAIVGEKEQALACSRKAVDLVPESVDAVVGPNNSTGLAQIMAWTGDKDGALKELTRLLQTPYGVNIYNARLDIGWLPLRSDPRFEALINNPTNNAPLINDSTGSTPLP
ncbi:MAG: adenylate/guanylate cyclase domain-containing protein [Limisphaerales bacterium]